MSNATHSATGGYLFKTVGGKTRYLHVEVVEMALGKPLSIGSEVHHMNGDPTDNKNSNLVICQDHKYHSLLHMRTEAFEVTGNANLRLCCVCQLYDNPSRMRSSGNRMYHANCMAFRSRMRRARIKSQGVTK